MLTEHFQALVERIAHYPPHAQDALAEALEAALEHITPTMPTQAPPLPPDAQAAFDLVIREHTADLAYLKDK